MRANRNIAGICVVCVCAILVFFAGCTTSSDNGVQDTAGISTDYTGEFADFDTFVGETLATYDVPGAYVGIVTSDGVILSEGYGVRGVGSTAPVDKAHIKNILPKNMPSFMILPFFFIASSHIHN